MDFLMDGFFLILLAVLLIGIQLRGKGIFEDYLAPENTSGLKGIFCIVIIFHHLSQRTQGGVLFPQFQSVGYLAVAVFFFLSGYGLMASFMRKGDSYRKGFLRLRLPSVLLPFLVIVNLYLLYFILVEKKTWVYLYDKLIWESNTWYIFALTFLYLFFFIAISAFHSKVKIIGAMLAAAGLYCVLCRLIVPDQGWWYNSCFALVFGIAWAAYKEKITAFIGRHWIFVFVLSLMLWWARYARVDSLYDKQPEYTIVAQEASVLFCIVVMCLAMKIHVGNRVIRFLGKISYELYLIHGLVILVVRSKHVVMIENNLLFSAVVLLGGIALAWPLHALFSLILKKHRALVTQSMLQGAAN